MDAQDIMSGLLNQTWQVALLAGAVWLLQRFVIRNQPQLTHLLWALVLVKAVVPPVWSSPTGVFSFLSSAHLVDSTEKPTTEVSRVVEEEQRRFPSRGIVVWLNEFQSEQQSPLGTRHGESLSVTSTLPDQSVMQTSQRFSVTGIAVTAWLVGTGLFLLSAILRSLCFWHWIRFRHKRTCSELERQRIQKRINAFTRLTANKLCIRKSIRVQIFDAPIGPAVIGLFRPSIVLPLRLVLERRERDLEPLIAHELIHVRRGDLSWALLQTLATGLLWFHPLVWFAARRLTLESERSCDEQTIAWLGCSPRTYALTLIDVLDRKHRLRSPPALPGVRPVDVTRNRLERIMKLGHGCRKTTPIWAWAVFLTAATIVVPGAATAVAQHRSDTRAPHDSAKGSQSKQLPLAPVANGPLQDLFFNARIEVGDLLKQLQHAGMSPAAARERLIQMLPQRTIEEINSKVLQKHDAKLSNFPGIAIDGTTLKIFETKEQIARVREFIEERREYGFGEVSIEIRMITVPKTLLKTLNVPWKLGKEVTGDEFEIEHFLNREFPSVLLNSENPGKASRLDVFSLEDGSHVVQAASRQAPAETPKIAEAVHKDKEDPGRDLRPTSLRVPATQLPAFYAILDEEEVDAFLKNLRSDPGANILQAPRVTGFNGQYVELCNTVQRPFVTGVKRIAGSKGMADQPVVQIAHEGIQLCLRWIINEDGSTLASYAQRESKVQGVETFTYDKSSGKDKYGESIETGITVQIPQLSSRFLALQASLQAGDSLLVTNGVTRLEKVNANSDEVLITVARIVQASPPSLRSTESPETDSTLEHPSKQSATDVSQHSKVNRLPPHASRIDIRALAIEKPSLYTLAPGDIISVQVENLLPRTPSDKAAPRGFPITVLEDGTISLPLLLPISVLGKDLADVQRLVQHAYLDSGIVAEVPQVTVTLQRRRHYNVLVWRLDKNFETHPQRVKLEGFGNSVLDALMASGGLPGPSQRLSLHLLPADKAKAIDIAHMLAAKKKDSDSRAIPGSRTLFESTGQQSEIAHPVPALKNGDHLFVLP